MQDSHRTAVMPDCGTLGILGGGQLGRMLASAAARLGLQTYILCPEENTPASQVCTASIIADYTDEATLAKLAQACDIVTYEFENVPHDAAAFLERRVPVRPGVRALAVAQDRLNEKTFLRTIGVPTADFVAVSDRASLGAAVNEIGFPAILKTRRFGYDGKGQARINGPDDLDAAWQAMAGAPSILEAFIPFSREVSIVAARGLDGTVRCYDASENRHSNHILSQSVVPAPMSAAADRALRDIAGRVLTELGYIGVLAVELFEMPGERFIANEIAPRVHNSGHWTLDACTVSQFEQHVRAVAGWPLGAPDRHADAVMTNILGQDVENWRQVAQTPGLAIHLYGKNIARAGRKMGHTTQLYPLTNGPKPVKVGP